MRAKDYEDLGVCESVALALAAMDAAEERSTETVLEASDATQSELLARLERFKAADWQKTALYRDIHEAIYDIRAERLAAGRAADDHYAPFADRARTVAGVTVHRHVCRFDKDDFDGGACIECGYYREQHGFVVFRPRVECENCGETYAETFMVDEPCDGTDDMCPACHRAGLAHGHAHGLHVDADGKPERVKDCPSCPDRRREADWMEAEVVRILSDKYDWIASVEHPGYVHIELEGGRVAAFGTAMSYWGGDLTDKDGRGIEAVTLRPTTYPNEQAVIPEDCMDAAMVADRIDDVLQDWDTCKFCQTRGHDVLDCHDIDPDSYAAALEDREKGRTAR